MFNLIQKFPVLANPFTGILAIGFAIVTYLVVPMFQDPVELPKLIAWYIFFGAAILGLYFSKPTKFFTLPNYINYLFIATAVLLVVNAIFSLDYLNTLSGVFPRYSNSVPFFLTWLLLIYLLARLDRTKLTSFLKLLAFLGFLVAAFGVLQYYGIGYYAGLTEVVRITPPSFLGNPIFSAMFVVTTIPLQFWFLVTAQTKFKRYGYLIMLVVSLLGAVFFNSRGAYAGLFAAVIMIGLSFGLVKKYRQALLVFAGIALLLVVTLMFYNVTRVDVGEKQAEYSEVTITSRFLAWDTALQTIKQYPLTGTGFANFFISFRANDHSALTDKEWFDDVHNVVLQTAATGGLPLALAMFGLLFLSVLFLLKGFWQEKNFLDVIVVCCVVAWLGVGSFTPVGAANWLLLAVLIAYGINKATRGEELVPARFSAKIWLLASGAAIALLGALLLVGEVSLAIAREKNLQNNPTQTIRYAKVAKYTSLDSLNARILLIQNLIKQKDYQQAQQEIESVLAMHPKSSGVYLMATEMYRIMYFATNNQEYKDLSGQATKNMIAHNSNYVAMYVNAARNMLTLKEPEQAKLYSKQAVVLDPDGFESWLNYAKASYELNQVEDTLLGLKKAYQEVPIPKIRETIKLIENKQSLDGISFNLN